MSYAEKLERLKKIKEVVKKRSSKPTKAPFDGFVGPPGRSPLNFCPPSGGEKDARPPSPKTPGAALCGTNKTYKSLHGISLAELRDLSDSDWSLLDSNVELLETYTLAVQTRLTRQRGEVPPEYTCLAECACCGPVFLWSGAPG